MNMMPVLKHPEKKNNGRWVDMENKRDPKHEVISYGKGYGMCPECQAVEWLYMGKTYCPYCGAKLIDNQEEV